VAASKELVHVLDYAAEMPDNPVVRLGGARSAVAVPMLKENERLRDEPGRRTLSRSTSEPYRPTRRRSPPRAHRPSRPVLRDPFIVGAIAARGVCGAFGNFVDASVSSGVDFAR
jgi:hypothetical protein